MESVYPKVNFRFLVTECGLTDLSIQNLFRKRHNQCSTTGTMTKRLYLGGSIAGDLERLFSTFSFFRMTAEYTFFLSLQKYFLIAVERKRNRFFVVSLKITPLRKRPSAPPVCGICRVIIVGGATCHQDWHNQTEQDPRHTPLGSELPRSRENV